MGAMFVSNKNETVRLFKNPILEYFSHIHPATPVVVFVPLAVWMLWQAFGTVSVMAMLLGLIGGVLLWTIFEYVVHRWAFHYEPTTTIGKKIHFLVHGVHHDYPRDATRLVMPLLVSLPLAVLFYWTYRAIFAPYHEAVFAGTLVGYVAYDTIHYATHHFPMTNRVGRFLKEYHMKHHYVDDQTAFGVSNPLWDYVFNTIPEWARRRGSSKRSAAI